MEGKIGFLQPSPSGVERGMVLLGIVRDDDDAAAGAGADPTQTAQEAPAGLGIEAVFRSGGAKLPVPEAHRAEVADALAGGRMQTDWIFDFWRNPHPATTAVPLEMDLIIAQRSTAGS